MGLNTTVVVLNDAVHEIERDPTFGQRLAEAIAHFNGAPQYIPAGCHGNVAMIVETHHADFDVLVKVGGNRGVVVKEKG